MLRLISACAVAISISGCVTTATNKAPETTKSKGTWSWYNANLYSSNLPDSKLDSLFNTQKQQCDLESFQVQIPPPLCFTPPQKDCSQLTGFAAGVCMGNNASIQPQCDYRQTNIAKDRQRQVFKSCMTAAGWTRKWTPPKSISQIDKEVAAKGFTWKGETDAIIARFSPESTLLIGSTVSFEMVIIEKSTGAINKHRITADIPSQLYVTDKSEDALSYNENSPMGRYIASLVK